MENFIIESTFEKEGFIKLNLIKWEVHWFKNKKQIRNYAIISLVLLFLGFTTSSNEEPITPFLIFGFASVVGTLFVVYTRLKSKKTYKNKILEIADRFESEKMDCIYEFSEEEIRYKDKEKELNFKWSVFTDYTIYKDCIILFLEKNVVDSYIFDKTESDTEDYNRILEFAKAKLKFRKL